MFFQLKAGVELLSFLKRRSRHLRVGKLGEKLAVRLLKFKKYDILLCNYDLPSGEIDIIARDGAMLVFVEVKTRRYTTNARPGEGLTYKQKQRIRRSGMHYLKEIHNPAVIYRFDLIEVVIGRYGFLKELRHWLNHF